MLRGARPKRRVGVFVWKDAPKPVLHDPAVETFKPAGRMQLVSVRAGIIGENAILVHQAGSSAAFGGA